MKTLQIYFKKNLTKSTFNKLFLILAVFFGGIAGYAYFAFLPLYLSDLGFLDGEVIFIMMWMGIGIAIFSWIFGKISDKTGKRKIFFVVGLMIQILAFFLIRLNNSMIFLCSINFLRGFSLGMRIPPSNALFADIVEKSMMAKKTPNSGDSNEIKGAHLSFLNTTRSTGWAIGVIFSDLVINAFGIESLIWFLIIASSISLMFSLPVKDIKRLHDKESNKEKQGSKEIPNKLKNHEGKPENSKVKILLFISVFFRQFGLIPFIQIISLMLFDANIPDAFTGIIIAINPISQIFAMILMGRLVDNPKVTEKTIMSVGFILSALTLAFYWAGSASSLVIFFVFAQICLGFGWGCVYTGANKYIVNRAHYDRALYMGIWATNLQIAKIISYWGYAFLWLIIIPQITLPFAIIFPCIAAILVLFL